MTGEVTDASGAVVANTIVTLTNPARGIKFTVKTNNEGAYRFPNAFELAVGTTRTQNVKMLAGTTAAVEASTV